MKVGLYPGCSLTGSSRDYNESVMALAKAFDVQLIEVPDWNCCGATAAHNLNKDLSLALPTRILAIAESHGITDLIVPCAACFGRLTTTKHELNAHPDSKVRIAEIIEMPYTGKVNVLNVIEWIDRFLLDKIEEKKKQDFAYTVACYYGCLLVRPPKVVRYDRVEDPQTMDEVMRKIGATPIDFPFKTECCGAGFTMSRTDIVAKLSGKVVEDASQRQAEAIIVACPMCHSNLDMRRPDINKFYGQDFKIPVVYITQALGLALGLSAEELGLNRHFVPVRLPQKVTQA